MFADHRAGIQLIIPAGWMPIRVNEEEYYKAFTLDVVLANPAFFDRLTKIQECQSQISFDWMRLISVMDIPPMGSLQTSALSLSQAIFGALKNGSKLKEIENLAYDKFQFISSSYPQTDNGTRVLVIEQSWSAGQTSIVYYRGVFFSLSSGTMVLDFYANFDFKDTVLPDFEQVVNSLTLLNP